MIATEFLCKVEVTLEPARELGETPLGRRRIIEITGGRFTGERLSGKVLPQAKQDRAIAIALHLRSHTLSDLISACTPDG